MRTLSLSIFLLFNLTLSAQWQKISSPFGGDARCVIRNATHVIAACNYRVYYSTDDANSWTPSQGLSNSNVAGFIFVGNRLLAYGGFGIMQSVDNGETFTAFANNLPPQGIIFIKQIDSLLWCGQYSNGLFHSVDSGLTWISANTNLNLNPTANTLIKHGADLFVGTDSLVFRSSNNGATWTPANGGLYDLIHSFLSYGNILFAGTWGHEIYKSTDNGQTWVVSGTGIGQVHTNSMARFGNDIYATTTNNGIYFSSDSGQTWTTRNDSIGVGFVSTIFEYNNVLYIPTGGSGIYISNDYGVNWIKKSNGMESVCDKMVRLGNNIYLITQGDGINISNDNGLSWHPIFRPPLNSFIRSICVNDTEMYAGIHWQGVYRSTNAGSSWTQINNGIQIPTIIEAAYLYLDSPYVWLDCNYGMYKSIDQGSNWIRADSGLGYPTVKSMTRMGDTLFAGINFGGVYRTKDNGVFWEQINNTINNNAVLNFEVYGNKIIAFGTNGIWSSIDHGDTWTLISNPPGTGFCSARYGPDLFIGTAYAGVLVSGDTGITWVSNSAGLPPNATIMDMLIKDGYMIISTLYDGIWRRPFSEVGISEDYSSSEVIVYPNPTNDKFTIAWSTSKPKMQIELTDLFGRVIKKYDVLNSDKTIVELDLKPGLYLINLKGDDFTVVKKIIVN